MPERDALEVALQRIRETKFVGLEYFGSRDETTRQASLDKIDRSSLYVGIFAGRYGSGITEAEYRRARERGLPCLIYFKDDAAISDTWRETDSAQAAKLEALKRELRANHIIGPDFKSPDDLAARVTADLHRWLFDNYLTPKLRGALSGQIAREEAQALLDAVRDLSGLNRDLVTRLQGAGFRLLVGEDFVGRDNIVTNIYNAPAVSAPAIPTRHQLRAPVGDFVGREREIADLTAALRNGGSAAITGISGMGGIGKTELAFYVANELRDAYPDAQLVLDMRGTDEAPRDPADALAACIRAFHGLEQRLPDDLQELTKIYRSTLEGKRALILLDNASDSAQVRPLLPPFGSVLIITSRSVVTLPRITRVTLEQLSPIEARELLRGIAPRIPADTADRICYLCGYLPLAVRAAGSLLDVAVELDPADYADQLSDERRRLELIGTEGVSGSVEASLNLSYSHLSPDAARVFRKLSVFPTSFDAKAEEVICEDESHEHLSELLRRNLVLYNEETQRHRLHDLARLFADSRLSDTERNEAQQRHAAYYLEMAPRADDESGDDDIVRHGANVFAIEWSNIRAGQSWAARRASESAVAAQLANHYPLRFARLINSSLDSRERLPWFEGALSGARRLKDRVSEGMHLNNLGVLYAELGDVLHAVSYFEQAWSVSREIGNRATEETVLGNLGTAYVRLGDLNSAVETITQQLAIAREVGYRRGEARALSNLGRAYSELNEWYRAVELHEQALTILREIGDSAAEAQTLFLLGHAYGYLKESRRALEFYQVALGTFQRVADKRGEAISLQALGQTHEALGEMQQAAEFYELTLKLSREIADTQTEMMSLNKLGATYGAIGQIGQAISYYRQSLELARHTAQTSTAADILFSMGKLVLESGSPAEEAERYLSESEKLYRQLNSPIATTVASMLSDLVSLNNASSLLLETTKKFFSNAGFRLSPIPETQLFRGEFSPGNFRNILSSPIFIRVFQGENLDDDQVRAIYEQTHRVDASATVVVVVTDDRPTDAGWAQIGTLRGRDNNPFVLLPIESVLINEGIASGRERTLLHGEVVKRMGGRYDPYDLRDPVAGSFSFFGREPIINDLLRGVSEGRPVGLFGLRKLGKSSLLKALSNRATFPVASVNLQTAGDDSFEDLFARITKLWKESLRVHYDMLWSPPVFTAKGATNTFVTAVRDLLDQIEHKCGEARLGLLLDEIEVIVPRPDGTGPDLKRYLTLLRALRGLVDEGNRLSLIVAGLNPSVNRINSWDGEQNPTFSLFQDSYLPPLAVEDCIQMVRNIGKQVGLEYDEESLKAISELSGGHPFLARQLCSLLYNKRNFKDGLITFSEIPPCTEDFIYSDDKYVPHLDAGIWRDAGNPTLWGEVGGRINQILLLELARAREPIPRNRLQGGPDSDARRAALIGLERFQFIYQPEPDTFAIRFGLLREWLRRRKLGLEPV